MLVCQAEGENQPSFFQDFVSLTKVLEPGCLRGHPSQHFLFGPISAFIPELQTNLARPFRMTDQLIFLHALFKEINFRCGATPSRALPTAQALKIVFRLLDCWLSQGGRKGEKKKRLEKRSDH